MAFLHNTLERPDKSPETRLDFFFSARGTELQHTSLGMFRSLLNQIFDGDETVRPLVREFYNQRCRLLGGQRTWEWPLNKLEELLADTILASAKRKPIIVFVDALDEAGATSARQLAPYFHQLVDRAEEANLPLQVYISCRHHPIVETAQATEVCVENHNHEDIATYVRDTLAESNVEEYVHQREMDKLVQHLIRKANRVFQWVHIMVPRVIDYIFEGQTFDEIPSWLSEVPTELKDLYTYILNHRILPKNREQSILFFKWVCFAERPLTVVEMRYALAAPNAQFIPFQHAWEKLPGFVDDDDRMVTKVKALSGGLAEIVSGSTGKPDKTIQVVHESVSDFFHERGLALLYPDLGIGIPSSNETLISQCQATLYQSCLVYLAAVLVPRNTRGRNSTIKKKALQTCPLLPYTSENTFIHAEKAGHSRVGALQNEFGILHQVIPQWVKTWKYLCMGFPELQPTTGTTVLHIAAFANMLDILKSEVSSGADVTTKDFNGDTPLHFAAQRGHTAAAKILWRQGDEETRNNKGMTPLGAAAGRGNLEFVEWLLDKGVSLQAKSGYGLQEASNQGHQDVVRTLLGAGADINAQGGEYGSALQAAASYGRIEIVQILLDHDADVNAQGGAYGSALQAAAAAGSTEIVQILLDHHADVNAQGGEYGSALQAAATRYGSTEIVQILLDHHADVNAQGGKYGSALQAAASYGRIEIVQILLDHDADVNAQGGAYGSALQAAATRDGSTETVQILLDHHADVNAQDDEYGSALQAAVKFCKTEIVQILLNHHADVNAQDGEYGSVLQDAVATGSTEIVQILLDHHADVNAQGGEYGSVLQAAVVTGSTEIVQILLDHHADVNSWGGLFGSALQIAVYIGKSEIVQILLDYHADINAQGGKYGSALQTAAASEGTEILLLPLDDINTKHVMREAVIYATSVTKSTEIVQILLDHHADINAQGGFYGNALQAAVYTGKTEIVHILLDHHTDVNARGGKYGNALYAAACRGHIEIVQILLDHHADVNAQGGEYGSALCAAVHHQNTKTMQILLDHHADVNAQNGEVGSPLLVASIKAEADLVEIPPHAGADCLLWSELDRTSLHSMASKNMAYILERFPQLASILNHRDIMLGTPLQLAIYSGDFESAVTLISNGADPSLTDGYGRNALDWAQGHHILTKEIYHHCPSLTLTSPEMQEMCVRQSLYRISDMLSCSHLAHPRTVLHQAGRYFLFLNDVGSAQHLLQFSFKTFPWSNYTRCSRCNANLRWYSFVCRICPHLTFCRDCARETPEHTDRELLPNQKHELLEITWARDGEFPHFGPEAESMVLDLSKFILERLGPNVDVNEIEPSNDSMAHPASDKADHVSNPIFSQSKIIFAVFFGLLAILLGVLLF
ncbi:unnamed protein product [Penicillium olsonii]|nr:unnamed protein product [Penicillium olsonii]